MMEVQKQWVNVDGKWQHIEVPQGPTIPGLPQRRPAPPPPPAKQPPALPDRGADITPPQKKAPGLPARRADEGHRRPSDMALARRESNESMSSTATAETFLSARSNGTSITSNSGGFVVRAPEYDPALLPKLPPKRTQEEKDAEARALRFPKSKKAPVLPSRPKIGAVQPLARSKTQPAPVGNDHLNLPNEPEGEETLPARQPPLPHRGPSNAFQLPSIDKVRPNLPSRNAEEAPPALPRRSGPDESVPALPRRNGPDESTTALPRRNGQPIDNKIIPPPAKRSALTMGFNNPTPSLPTRPDQLDTVAGGLMPSLPTRPNKKAHDIIASALDGTPPPIPLSSRPDLSTLLASKPKAGDVAIPVAAPGTCLWCRDFSGPDQHAARFPRASLPSQDVGWLAQQLTAPFTSPTDKARVIFTWLHHNVAYNVEAFFNNNVKPSTPQSTLATGLAVCEGYAALFAALAMKVGLEAVVVGGHGKGYGHSASKPGDPVPPYSMGHAWNAVKIDGGAWKLIDACWGAGVIGGRGEPYKPLFDVSQFSKSNDEFGLSHFPDDRSKQFRSDGRVVTWEEYIMGNKSVTAAATFSGMMTEEGISETSFRPIANPIVLSQQGPVVRFSFQAVCPHWDGKKNGRGARYLHIMCIDELDGTQRNYPPFEHKDGVWWLDVPVRDLGKPGQKCMVVTVDSFDGGSGRGLTAKEYLSKKGRCAMGPFSGLAQWTME